MRIFISTLAYHGAPLLWEYDETQDKATCLFEVMPNSAGSSSASAGQSLRKFLVIDHLQKRKIAGVEINSEKASITISHVKSYFGKEIQFIDAPSPISPLDIKSIAPAPSPRSIPFPRRLTGASAHAGSHITPSASHDASRVKTPRSRTNSKAFFEISTINTSPVPTKRAQDAATPSTQTTKTSSGEVMGLQLEAILPESIDSNLRGDTLRYLPDGETDHCYFLKKFISDLETRRTVFDSPSTFTRKMSYLEVGELIPVKELQMILIKELFNKILAPLYKKQPVDSSLVDFFQKAIKEVMRNEPEFYAGFKSHNLGPTFYEERSRKELEEEFGQDPHRMNDAIHQVLFARARGLIRNFRFFITSDIKSYQLTPDTSVQAELDSLKTALQGNRALLAEACLLLEQLTELTAKSGRIATKHLFIDQTIKEQIKAKTDLSLSALMLQYAHFDTIEVGLLEQAKASPELQKLSENLEHLKIDGKSCFSFLLNFLQLKYPHGKDENLQKLTGEVIEETAKLLREVFLMDIQAPPIRYPDEADFYLPQEMIEQLKTNPPNLEKHHDRKKHREELVTLCSQWIYTAIASKLLKSSQATPEESAPPLLRRRSNTDSSSKIKFKENGDSGLSSDEKPLTSPRKAGLFSITKSKSLRDVSSDKITRTPTIEQPSTDAPASSQFS
ncbi:hypothetical protein [Legionella maceachernii]|uniref:Uncharacterized protein n=1 Tax=Legionella maceachernii TaxID=466 RepID=A0A0W0VTK9_9GAMM|nr:hypothetical protein [Legionella maceachernii]KTD23499.1 hypothetical protein Lmac_3175 [Legionella maceachernii]SJZ70232.1 hypothetical protein SAMN02745128_00842 [Legionella maceachernii]SUP02273.1 Uncharacterised protein [Legionella maceachernii]